ncbi:MAG: methyltransferase domain-containing protein [Rhodospirillales bacterium]|nr:methyltransferase domain-containing protein [Rhodospirillales bacterium]
MDRISIEQIKEKYNLTYHVKYAMEAEKMVGLRGKKVLEIGGSLPRDFVLDELGAERWIAIEELGYHREVAPNSPHNEILRANATLSVDDVTDIDAVGNYAIISGRAERLTPAFYSKFDVIFSIAAFEHIDRLPAALLRMYQALKPGGKLFTMFSPVWSAHDGHHLHGVIDKNGKIFTFENSPIPPWGHLIMRPPQMYQHLLNHTDEETASEIIYHVYNSTAINRLFTEDYVEYFKKSPFNIDSVIFTFKCKATTAILEHLQTLHPRNQNFENNGLLAVLSKKL